MLARAGTHAEMFNLASQYGSSRTASVRCERSLCVWNSQCVRPVAELGIYREP